MSETQPVTTVVTRHVRSDRRDEYEAWLDRLHAEAHDLPGYLGAEVHPPPTGAAQATYRSVFRFASLEDLRAFEVGELRRRFLDEVVDYVEADAVYDTHTGLELWFAPPAGTVVPQPIRWRMAVVLGLSVYVMVLVFGSIAGAVMGDVPAPIRLAIVIAVEIAIMTYLLLPWLTRKLSRWIYPSTVTAGSP
ncbi:MAG: hypothetical protein AAGA99_03025 [Actinomycetota bacterium]